MDLAQRSPLTVRVKCSLGWRGSAFAPCLYVLRAKSSVVSDSLRPLDCSPLGSSSMGFSRQEHWSGLPCPSPGDLPAPRIELASLLSPALAGRFFTTSATWKTHLWYWVGQKSSFKFFPCYQNLNELFWPTQYLSSCLPLERCDFPAESSWPEYVTAEKNILETNNWSKITLKSYGGLYP